jgi:hypothetical protein
MTEPSPSRPGPPPGWYQAPEGPFERWWDGSQWTAHARPLEPLSAPTPAPLSAAARAAGWLMAASGGLVVIGALLPWATWGPFTLAGTSGDGQITLVLGLVAIAVGVWRGLAKRPSGLQLATSVTAAVLGAIVTLIGLVDAADVSDYASVGGGLVLTIVAGLALVGASVFGVVRQR